MFKTIRAKTVILFTLLVILTELGVGSVGIYRSARYYHNSFEDAISSVFTDTLRQQLTDAANAVSIPAQPDTGSGIIINETGPDNIENIRAIVAAHSNELGLYTSSEFCILDGNGAVVYSSRGSSAVEASDVTSDSLSGIESISCGITNDFCDYALPLMSGSSVRYIIYIKDALSVQHAVTDRLWSELLFTVLISGTLAFIFSLLVSRLITLPIKTLSSQAKKDR